MPSKQQMEHLYLKKGAELALDNCSSTPVLVDTSILVDMEELRNSAILIQNWFDRTGVPCDLHMVFSYLSYEKQAGLGCALIPFAVLDIGIPVIVSESDWKKEYVGAEMESCLTALEDCGPFLFGKSTLERWHTIKETHNLPEYIGPSTLIALSAIDTYISTKAISPRLRAIAIMGEWAKVLGCPERVLHGGA